MTDTAVAAETAPPAASSPAAKKSKSGAAASKKPRVKPSHPPTSDMVNSAIKSLKERGGSSLQAIKKYITSNYKTDAEKLSPFIKKSYQVVHLKYSKILVMAVIFVGFTLAGFRYGGDVTRRMKLLKHQAEGKKKMRSIANVRVPHDTFISVLRR